MKALLKLLSPIPLVTFSAGGLAVLAAWAGYKLKVPLYLIAVILVAIVIIWILVLWILRLRATKAGESLERSIEAQARKQMAGTRPGHEKDIEQLKNHLLEAIAALKASRVGKGKKGAGALYVLPWYMIIGPPAAGKTTLLKKSGLNFPYLDPTRSDYSVKGVGGTRNCDWWFADEAVILDTAGRYTLSAEEDDTQEWLGFLELLRRYRGRKPINGLIIGISIQDLLSGSEEEIEKHGLRVRSRIDELIQHLGVTFPIYVLFTKCDLVRGFVEFFGDLSRTERGQAWGATVARDRASREPAYRIFEKEVDRLTDGLASAKIPRLAQVTQPEARPEVLFFPMQFAALKGRLSRFLEALFRPNPYQELPIFRGFYFTSGTQEGRPIDQVINAMLKGFGVATATEGMYVEPSQTKSYFIEDVFSKIAFPDRSMAGPSASGERRKRGLRLKTFLAGGGVLAFFLLILIGLFTVNHSLVYDAKSLADRSQASIQGGSSTLAIEDLQTLDRLRRKLIEMDGRHRPIVKAAFLGTYQGERAADQGRRMLVAVLREKAMDPAIPYFAEKLRTGSPTENYRRYYDWYRTWYLLQNPAARLQTAADAEQAAAALTDAWGSLSGSGGGTEEYRTLLRAQLEYATHYPGVLADLFPPLHGDPAIDAVALEKLRSGWNPEGLYPGLLQSAASVPAITVTTFVGPESHVAGSGRVDGAFTAAGWNGPVRDYLDWVNGVTKDPALRNAFGSEPPPMGDALLGRYADGYQSQWVDFLGATQVMVPNNDKDTQVFLERASTENSPVLTILRGVSQNTDIGKEGDSGVGGVRQSFRLINELMNPPGKEFWPPQKLKGSFSGKKAPYKEYLDLVTALKAGYAQIATSPNPGGTKEVLDLEGWVETHIGSETPVGREVGRLLTFPSSAVSKKVRMAQGGALAANWTSIYDEYSKNLADKYPLRADAHVAVAAADFEGFFGPTGMFWSFYRDHLKDLVSEDGLHVLKPDASLSPDFLDCVRSAYRIRRALFQSGDKAGFSLSLRPSIPQKPAPGIVFAKSRLEIGGNAIVYTAGPPVPMQIAWPGDSPEGGSSLSLDLRSTATATPLSAEGFWGFFRLLDQARVTSSGDHATIRWSVKTDKGEMQVSYEATGLPTINALEPKLLRFRCPPQIEASP